ncbi:MAG TPA: metallophosphatase family protein [Acidobacteria bacterium]|nr:metallophosphatase family protein [Acidobacteriota bacterium]
MRFLILSDIHSNIDALDAVLARTPPKSYDKLIVMGDLVGYGGTPNEVVDRIFELKPDFLIRGNHDKVASGVESADNFNRIAGEAARWTQSALTSVNRVGGVAGRTRERRPRGRGLSRDPVRRRHVCLR